MGCTTSFEMDLCATITACIWVTTDSYCCWFHTNIVLSNNEEKIFSYGNILILLWAYRNWITSIDFILLMVVTLLSLIKCFYKFLPIIHQMCLQLNFYLVVLVLFINVGLVASNSWVVMGKVFARIWVQFPFKYIFFVGCYANNQKNLFQCKGLQPAIELASILDLQFKSNFKHYFLGFFGAIEL